MAKIDQEYHKLINVILSDGFMYEDPNRKGINRIQIPSYTFKHSFEDGFPAITTKKIYWRGVVSELLFFLSGSSDITWLKEQGNNIWNKDVANFDPLGSKSVGKSYGYHWRHFGGVPDVMPIDNTPVIFEKLCNIEKSIDDKIYSSNNYGDFIVLNKLNNKSEIQFINTGYKKIVKNSNWKRGLVLDPYHPSHFGVACIGEPDTDNLYLDKLKSIWKSMISRCYNPKNKDYKNYGFKGVKVCNRWKIFANYMEDVVKLDNWQLKIKDWNTYHLDKDINGNGFEYSLKNCKWATTIENSRKACEKYEYCIYKGDKELIFRNLSEVVGSVFNNHTELSKLLKDKVTHHLGWKLKYKKPIKNGFDQITNLIYNLRSNPMSTQHVIYNYNPLSKDETSLPSCHWSFEILVEPLSIKERINISNRGVRPLTFLTEEKEYLLDKDNIPKYQFTLKWHQRSVDTFLGLPFNIASYALLAQIIGKMVNMVPKGIEGDLSNVHLYEPHLDSVMKQLERNAGKYSKSELTMLDEFHYMTDTELVGELSTNTIINKLRIDMFKLQNYNSYPTIKAEMLPYNK